MYCAAILAANTSMRGVEVMHVRRRDFDAEKRVVHVRASKNETSKRVIPLNDSAFDAVQRMVTGADTLGHSDPHHYLWCASKHHKLDPTKPASKRPSVSTRGQSRYARTRRLARGFEGELELETLSTLKVTNHFEQIARLRIPGGAEHAH